MVSGRSPFHADNPIKAFTLGGIIRDAGPTIEEFRLLL
jgi:hypothetical protein